jgi:ABC-type molybdate transport system ATPase subunit
VVGVSPHGAALRLVVHATDGRELIADVTPDAATELGLVPGRDVWVSVKETSVRSYDMPGSSPSETDTIAP